MIAGIIVLSLWTMIGMVIGGALTLLVVSNSIEKKQEVKAPEEYEKIKENIRTLAVHYSRKSQWEKAVEEVDELYTELENAGNPFGYEDIVSLTCNTWSEIADVIIMCTQLAMQHGKTDTVRRQIVYKVERQLRRIENEEKPIHEDEEQA